MTLAGCQIIPIDFNSNLQKCLEIFDKNSADKIQSKKNKKIKVSPFMPIRVKCVVVVIFLLEMSRNQESSI